MIKVFLPARDIPLDSLVTKKGGGKKYTLRDRLRVFGEDGGPRELIATEGTKFIVAENGDANVVAATTELLWYAPEYQLMELLGESGDTK